MGDLHQQTLNVLWLQGQLAVLALVLDWDGLQTIMLFLHVQLRLRADLLKRVLVIPDHDLGSDQKQEVDEGVHVAEVEVAKGPILDIGHLANIQPQLGLYIKCIIIVPTIHSQHILFAITMNSTRDFSGLPPISSKKSLAVQTLSSSWQRSGSSFRSVSTERKEMWLAE